MAMPALESVQNLAMSTSALESLKGVTMAMPRSPGADPATSTSALESLKGVTMAMPALEVGRRPWPCSISPRVAQGRHDGDARARVGADPGDVDLRPRVAQGVTMAMLVLETLKIAGTSILRVVDSQLDVLSAAERVVAWRSEQPDR